MSQHDQAPVMQIEFKKQVQEWKNIPLYVATAAEVSDS